MIPFLRALHPQACGIVVQTEHGPTGYEVMRPELPHMRNGLELRIQLHEEIRMTP
jgi:hypothetical protein